MSALTIFAPAKLNLYLAVTGRRPDGYHDLVSVVAPLQFGDTLIVSGQPADAGRARFELSCDDAAVPVDESNLILKAAEQFAAATGWKGGASFDLRKRIPMGAGLGGGSSDAVAALKALNELAGGPLSFAQLTAVAAQVGSDCPLFLHSGPVVMRGRGERVEPLPARVQGQAEPEARLRGRRVLLFMPAFPIPTPWAYSRMIAQPDTYLEKNAAEARLADWLADPSRPVEEILFNNMEFEIFKKFLALPVLLGRLRRDFGLVARMSGSGSACFAFLAETAETGPIREAIRAAWGESAWMEDTRLA